MHFKNTVLLLTTTIFDISELFKLKQKQNVLVESLGGEIE